MDPTGKSDPYCVVIVGNQEQRTVVQYSTVCPTWHETLQFEVSGVPQLMQNEPGNNNLYYPTLLRRVQISRETSTNITRYLYSPHSSRAREVQNLGKSEFWEKKSLDNKSLIRRFGV